MDATDSDTTQIPPQYQNQQTTSSEELTEPQDQTKKNPHTDYPSATDQPIINGRYPDGTFAKGNGLGVPRTGCPNIAKPWFDGNLSEENIKKLETMHKYELITLLKTLGGIVGYALQTNEERTAAAELKLYSLGMQSTDASKAIPALKEWYDRTKGKPLGYSPTINVGAGSSDKQVRVIFVNAEDVRRERERNLIEGQVVMEGGD